MAKERIIIEFYERRDADARELDVPADIPAEELVRGLNEAFRLGMDPSVPQEFHLQAEEPIALLKGGRTLREFGLHNGSRVYCPAAVSERRRGEKHGGAVQADPVSQQLI